MSVMNLLGLFAISAEHNNPFACHKTFTAYSKSPLCSAELAIENPYPRQCCTKHGCGADQSWARAADGLSRFLTHL